MAASLAKTHPNARFIWIGGGELESEFRDLVAAQLAHYGDSTLFNSGGMEVKTTLDLNLQEAATQALGQRSCVIRNKTKNKRTDDAAWSSRLVK